MLHGDAKYIDILEKSLYNGLISGVGMDGKSFFYTNAMEIRNSYNHHDMEGARSGWFTCSCCPTNITRLIPSVPGYMYAQEGNNLYVNLFINSTTKLKMLNKDVQIVQQNNYPWDGKLQFTVTPAAAMDFNMRIRIPGWAQHTAMPSDLYSFTTSPTAQVNVLVNGKAVQYAVEKGFAVLKRTWRKGDVVVVDLPMEIQKVKANPKVKDDLGKIALQRGPLVYCAEWADNNGKTSNILLTENLVLKSDFKKDLLQGVVVLEGEVSGVQIDSDGQGITTVKQSFTAIPYYAWAHRGKGEMTIWFPEKVTDIEIISK